LAILDFHEAPKIPEVSRGLARQNTLSIGSACSDEDDISTQYSLEDATVNFSSFTIIEELGAGAFGKVYKVLKTDTREIFAMKALSKTHLMSQNQLKYAIGECRILKNISSKFIIKLFYAFQTAKNLYLILEYCPNGDLSCHLAERNRFSEGVAKFYIAEVIMALEYLHIRDIVYRDLKPENILLDSRG
jgi:protein-serine/threonine kinase